MSQLDYHCVVVGARCAGAALAAFLARGGASVLVVERAARGRDHVLSTHTVHPAGTVVLDELGVGDAVRSLAPAMPRVRMRKGAAELVLELARHQWEYCPRRGRLDGLLQDAAEEAGAALRFETRVVDLLRDGARVTGVRVRDRDGREREIRARVVVGADGRDSTVASLAGAEETFGYDAPRAMFWGYWPRPSGVARDLYIGHVGGGIRVVFHTDGDRLLVGTLPPLAEARPFRERSLAAMRDDLARDPYTATLDLGEPDEPLRGIVKARYFVRRAAGPGWALVGDAGLHKEYLTGDGMSQAFVQARALARAILDGGDAALVRYWHERDVAALPWFFYGQDQGVAGERPELDELALERLAGDPARRARVGLMLEHLISPYEVVAPAQALRWTLGAVCRGRFAVWRQFMWMGRRSAFVARTVGEARQRLAACAAPRRSTRAFSRLAASERCDRLGPGYPSKPGQ